MVASSRNHWLPSSGNKSQGHLRLFCFPYAGGGASLFHSWSAQLPPEIEVCPVQLPGRENRLLEQGISQIDALIQPLTIALLPYLDKPYAFFGHSMGALISFELSRALRRFPQVSSPVRLIVSGRRAPQLPDLDPPTHALSDDDFIMELHRLKGTPKEVLQNADLLQIVLPLLRADFALCETYTYIPDTPLNCPITAIGGLEDSEVTREEVAAWNKQTTNQEFKLRFFPGDHFFLHKQQPALLRVIAQDLLQSMHELKK